jgi:putative ATP-grasp target RiPP
MDDSRGRPVPLLLRFSQPAPVIMREYKYDPEMEINVIVDANGDISPAVEGPHAGTLTKTTSRLPGGGEDR